jgi:hypothetical protein
VCASNVRRFVARFHTSAGGYRVIPGVHDHGPANPFNNIKMPEWIGTNNDNYTTTVPGTRTALGSIDVGAPEKEKEGEERTNCQAHHRSSAFEQHTSPVTDSYPN